MYFYLYKITNNLNGKIYIGVHKTSDLEDGYMGSGVYLNRAIRKHGPANFTKEILQFFTNEEKMYLTESIVVNSNFISRNDVYNVNIGGKGTFSYINQLPNQGHKKEQRSRAAKAAGDKHSDQMKNNPDYRNKHNNKRLTSFTKTIHERSIGLRFKPEPKMWITNLQLNVAWRVPASLYPEYYDQGWIKERKVIFNKKRGIGTYQKRN